MLVDTHAHLYAEEFDDDRNEVIDRALEVGVERIILPDVDSTSRAAMLAMASQYPCCTPMVGVHPTSINDNPAWREELSQVESLLAEDSARFCGVGEIGLDLYWSRDFEAQQREAFRFQVDLALKYSLPVAIHCRDAWEALLEELTPYASRGVRGVIHAFTGEVAHYNALSSLGDFLFGIGGVVTFKKSALAAVVAQIPLEKIVFETDAPYLTPTPFRGKRNESAYVPYIAQVVADLHAESVEETARITSANAARMFF